ncbi:DUF4192 domain-containing protein [Nocardioides coralli]|nr:DUF4192 domain-containing protein [Nocardioides coralli]
MTSAHPHDTAPRSLTARSPEDLLAVARVVLGFDPDDSLVLLTVGPGRTFHARVDLPSAEHDLHEVARVLVEPATRHRVQAAVMLLYTGDHLQARRAFRRVGAALERGGVELVDGLRVHDGRWYPLRGDRASHGPGVPYDISAHPFVAQAILEGRVLHGSRRALAATVESEEAAVALVEAARTGRRAGAEWVEDVVARLIDTGASPGPDEAAGLLEAIAVPHVRDVAWWGVRRERARDHVRL